LAVFGFLSAENRRWNLTFPINSFRRNKLENVNKLKINRGNMKSNKHMIQALNLGLGILLAMSISGCWVNTGYSPSQTATPSGGGTPEKTKKTTAVYHDFEDVLVPMELSVMKDRTVVVSTPGFRSGILALKGSVDSNSLYDFFSINMAKDNWNVVSKIKSSGTIIMVYAKTTRCAVITIRDSQITTYVEIGVAPTMGNTGGEMTQTGLSE